MGQNKLNRRTFLLGVGASSILAACGGGGGGGGGSAVPGGGAPAPVCGSGGASATALTPLTIDATQTDLPCGTPVYAYIVGEVQTSAGNMQYRLDASGTPHPMSTADNTLAAGTFPGSAGLSGNDAATLAANYPQRWADYSIPVSLITKTVIDLANLNTSTLPGLGTGTAAFSGRIYMSVGIPKLPFSVLSGTQYTAPVPLGYPGQLTLFDWIEFSYDSNGQFNGNTTQVDQFGFPLLLNGTPGGTLQGQFNRSRPAILSAVAALGAEFDQSIAVTAASAYPAGITSLRALSPKSITGQSLYSGGLSTYFDSAVHSWYAQWTASNPVTVTDLASGTFSGTVQGGTLTFTQGGAPALTIANSSGIPSVDIWQCANSLATGSAAAKNVQKILAAAFNRGHVSNNMSDVNCSGGPFYSGVSPVQTFNPWAQLFHQVSTNGLAYAFPYDDVCNQNPSISLMATQSVTVTLGKFFS
ncbi:MAG: Tat pathway signal protein [Burkholderiales bacterium]|nr:Tat pathway signal protein [Burkholderiales bacterium]